MSPIPSDESPLLDLPLSTGSSEPRRAGVESGRGADPGGFDEGDSSPVRPRRRARRKAAEDGGDSLPLFAGIEIERTLPTEARKKPGGQSRPRAEDAPAPAAHSERDGLERAVAHAAAPPEPEPRARREAPTGSVASHLRAVPQPEPAQETDESSARFRERLQAGFADGLILAGVGAAALLSAEGLGAAARGWMGLLAVGTFLLSWSFLYFVVTLAFWGQTPGMAWARVRVLSQDGEAISFGQAAWRWAGFWLVLASGGVLGLLGLSGRSLADRLSKSTLESLPAPAEEPELV